MRKRWIPNYEKFHSYREHHLGWLKFDRISFETRPSSSCWRKSQFREQFSPKSEKLFFFFFLSVVRGLTFLASMQVRHKYFRKIPREIVNLYTLECLIIGLFLALLNFCTFLCRTLSNFYTKFDFFFQIVWDFSTRWLKCFFFLFV